MNINEIINKDDSDTVKEYDENGNLIKSTSSNGKWFTKTYTNENKTIRTDFSNKDWYVVEYDDYKRLIRSEDSSGYRLTNIYGADGELVKTTEVKGLNT